MEITKRRVFFRRLRTLGAVVLLAASLGGCVVAPWGPHPGWCYWHPYRCR